MLPSSVTFYLVKREFLLLQKNFSDLLFLEFLSRTRWVCVPNRGNFQRLHHSERKQWTLHVGVVSVSEQPVEVKDREGQMFGVTHGTPSRELDIAGIFNCYTGNSQQTKVRIDDGWKGPGLFSLLSFHQENTLLVLSTTAFNNGLARDESLKWIILFNLYGKHPVSIAIF